MTGAEPDDLPERIEAARKIFAGPMAFLKSAPGLQFLPDPDVPLLVSATTWASTASTLPDSFFSQPVHSIT